MTIAPKLMTSIKDKVEEVMDKVKDYSSQNRFNEQERQMMLSRIQSFNHNTETDGITIGAVDSNGDFPSVSYLDSYVYWVIAQSAIYSSDSESGLREKEPLDDLFHLVWMPEQEDEKNQAFDQAFNELSASGLFTVVRESDYRAIKAKESGKSNTVESLVQGLIRPSAVDSSNIGIQFKHTAELGLAAKILASDFVLDYLLVEGTFSLPYAPARSSGLFFEHLKRYCLTLAQKKGTGFFSISKLLNFPFLSELEELATEKQNLEHRQVAEHWYLRLPIKEIDDWFPPRMDNINIPPPGTVTYLFRLHKNLPVMRLDMGLDYWVKNIQSERDTETLKKEQKIFEDLDYASHDQRGYGYPYPLMAVKSRVNISKADRALIRKQIIDAGVNKGLERKRFI